MKFFLLTTFLTAALVGVSQVQAGCDETFKKAFLQRHNQLRAKHGSPALALDNEINNWAQQWADELAKTDTFKHRQPNKYGENLYMSWSSNKNAPLPDGSVPVQSWYDEIKDYRKDYYGHEPDMGTFAKWGHFTQVVWKGSAKVGVGCAKNPSSNKLYIVGNYSPPGNFQGRFAANVPKPL